MALCCIRLCDGLILRRAYRQAQLAAQCGASENAFHLHMLHCTQSTHPTQKICNQLPWDCHMAKFRPKHHCMACHHWLAMPPSCDASSSVRLTSRTVSTLTSLIIGSLRPPIYIDLKNKLWSQWLVHCKESHIHCLIGSFCVDAHRDLCSHLNRTSQPNLQTYNSWACIRVSDMMVSQGKYPIL